VYFFSLPSKTFTALLNTPEFKTYRPVSRGAESGRLYLRKDFSYSTTNRTASADTSLEPRKLMRSAQDPVDGHCV
jgi:hypothetical protein